MLSDSQYTMFKQDCSDGAYNLDSSNFSKNVKKRDGPEII